MKGTDIVKVAKSFVGQQEIKGNLGFVNDKFQKIMESVGWRTGQAWCSYFGEVCWTLSVKNSEATLKLLNKLFSGSATRTMKNFEEAGYTRSAKAKVGSLAIWQNRKRGLKQWTGHVGIVVEVHEDYFISIEGNTNGEGAREGEVVAQRKRRYDFDVHHGLELQGFIHPISNVKDSITDELPFKNKKEGDKFREWFNDNYPEKAREIDLDRSGSHKNSFILKAYEIAGDVYQK